MSDNTELSEREREILELVATGASNKEIAQKLSISTNTVKVHVRNIFAKAGVVSRTEATLYAIREGVIRVDAPMANGSETIIPPLSTESAEYSSTRPRVRRFGWLWILSVPAVALVLIGSMLFVARNVTEPVSASPVIPTLAYRWQSRAMLPTARTNLAAVVYENQIYVIGGETQEGVLSATERYDPSDNTWVSLPPKPVAVSSISAEVIGGKIYVPGGRLASGEMTEIMEVYDPRQNQWERRASMPTAISGYGTVAFEGRLLLFGGWDGRHVLGSVYEYDPEQDTWRTRTAMPTARAYAGVAAAGNKIYVIGGYDGNNAVAYNEEYTPERENDSKGPWAERVPLPSARYSMGVTSLAGIIHVVGGLGDGKEVLTPLEYFPQQDKWQSFEAPLAGEWSHLALVPSGTQLYALGGQVGGIPMRENRAYQAIYIVIIPAVR